MPANPVEQPGPGNAWRVGAGGIRSNDHGGPVIVEQSAQRIHGGGNAQSAERLAGANADREAARSVAASIRPSIGASSFRSPMRLCARLRSLDRSRRRESSRDCLMAPGSSSARQDAGNQTEFAGKPASAQLPGT
jgi:hypothetical protein